MQYLYSAGFLLVISPVCLSMSPPTKQATRQSAKQDWFMSCIASLLLVPFSFLSSTKILQPWRCGYATARPRLHRAWRQTSWLPTVASKSLNENKTVHGSPGSVAPARSGGSKTHFHLLSKAQSVGRQQFTNDLAVIPKTAQVNGSAINLTSIQATGFNASGNKSAVNDRFKMHLLSVRMMPGLGKNMKNRVCEPFGRPS